MMGHWHTIASAALLLCLAADQAPGPLKSCMGHTADVHTGTPSQFMTCTAHACGCCLRAAGCSWKGLMLGALRGLCPAPELVARSLREWAPAGWLWCRHWYGEVLQHQDTLQRAQTQLRRPGGNRQAISRRWGLPTACVPGAHSTQASGQSVSPVPWLAWLLAVVDVAIAFLQLLMTGARDDV